jgi:hypothetical protein
MENTSIRVGVFDCQTYNFKQKLVRISEDDMLLKSIDPRSRYLNRSPECWIFVDTTVVIPNGMVTLKIAKTGLGEWKKYFYDIPPVISNDGVIDKVENLCESSTAPSIIGKKEEGCHHAFRPSIELKILYCEKCGKVVFIENVGK